MAWVYGRPLRFFLMFILVKVQSGCYRLHFTHRKTGLREHKGLLGHVALRGQSEATPTLPVLEVRLFLGICPHSEVEGAPGSILPTPTPTRRLPAPSSRAQQASLEGHSLSMLYYSSELLVEILVIKLISREPNAMKIFILSELGSCHSGNHYAPQHYCNGQRLWDFATRTVS